MQTYYQCLYGHATSTAFHLNFSSVFERVTELLVHFVLCREFFPTTKSKTNCGDSVVHPSSQLRVDSQRECCHLAAVCGTNKALS